MKRFNLSLFAAQKILLKALTGCVVLGVFAVGTVAASSYTNLHDFNCAVEACNPEYDGFAQGRDGNLYGTAFTGGSFNLGAVFRVTPAGSVTVIYSFDGASGSDPFAGLTLGTDGSFYGATYDGGTFGHGTLFKITPRGKLTVLHQFGSVVGDGAYPYAAPAQATDHGFYGVTSSGTAYKVTAAGVFTILNSAAIGTTAPLIQASDGNFYGTSIIGCNCVFKLTRAGAVSIVYNFDGTHGNWPFGPVTEGADGMLYGTTYAGGASNQGVIFRLSTSGAITVLSNATTQLGHPVTGLLAATDGNFYGASGYGGGLGFGTLFKSTATGSTTIENAFDGYGGRDARATPMQHTNGKIYGLTFAGGAYDSGVFFSLDEGLAPFISMTAAAARVGASVGILGQDLTGATAVAFGGTDATSFTVVSDTYMTAVVPSGALTGNVTVTTPSGTLTSVRLFRIKPAIQSVRPRGNPLASEVIITGSGLTQTKAVRVGGKKVSTFTVNSDSQITVTIAPFTATTRVAITTDGGKTSRMAFLALAP